MADPLVLALNPGAGSTKLALFCGDSVEKVEKIEHPELKAKPTTRIWEELPARLAAAKSFLDAAGVRKGDLLAAVGRGGLLPPLSSGTWAVDDAMLEDLRKAERGEHASNLGAPLARAVAEEHDCRAFIVDPVSVDELMPVARVTGVLGIERRSMCHALNIRAVARRYASRVGRPLHELRLVVAHLGTGISLAALLGGRMVDVVNPKDEGPFSGDRAGGVPATALVDLCFAKGAEAGAVRRRLFGDGGLYSHLGTRDAREALKRAANGDGRAGLIVDAMAYQTAKAAAGLAAVFEGRVDAVILTGGLAYLAEVVEAVSRRVAWIAPVEVMPGEDELRALAEGALRVLRGEETARKYSSVRR